MGFIHRILFGESALSKQEKLTIIKCLSCVVWADSNFDDKEGVIIQEIIREIKDIPEKEIINILSTEKSLSPELMKEIKALPEVQSHTILKYLYRIANADGEINDSELQVLRKISELILPGKDWQLVLDWIDANNQLLKSTRRLFQS